VFLERNERSGEGTETLLSVSAYTGVTPRADLLEDGEPLSRSESFEGYKVCHPDDLVVNIMLAWNRGLSFTSLHGIVSPAYCVYSVIDDSVPRFLNYLVRSDEYIGYFKAFSSGVIDSRLRIYPDVFGRLYVALPPRGEQAAIAAFLDRETAKIDALIAEQEKLISLLKEKRQALISHAVTKGLNPNAPMKDSGIEWLGQVPACWEVRRLKTISNFTTSGPRGWSERVADGGSLFIQSGDLNDALGVDFGNAKRVEVSDDAETQRTRLQNGDVVVCITGAKTGNCAVCSEVPEDAYINQHLCLVRPNSEVVPEFLGMSLRSCVGQIQFELSQYGLKQGLSLENVRETFVAVPSAEEQRDIVAWLDKEILKFDTLQIEANRAIELFTERRAALISAAVTGKIDVRGLVPTEVA
jgi:type I restriction enzyme S subunit